MATNKLGTLVYDLVADTEGFQKGLVKGGKQLTALKKLFLESRTPVEAFGIQLQGMHQMIMDGAKPINMFSRSIADLALKTKGGGREARNFVQSLRDQASQMIANVGQYRVLSQADRTRVDRLRAVANAIEREVNIQRQSAAEKLKNKRALEQETAAAKEADAEQKRLSQEREKQIAIERRQAEQRIAYQQKIDRLRQQSRARAKSESIRQAEQQEASRLAMVRSELQKTISPQQRLVSLSAAARAEYAAGNITREQLIKLQRSIVTQLREINPEYIKQQEALARVNAELQKRAEHEQRINNILNQRRERAKQAGRQQAEAFEAERLGRVKSILEQTVTPQQRLTRLMADAREEMRLGNITRKEFLKVQGHIKKQFVELKNSMVPYGTIVEKTRGRLERFGEGMALQVGALAKQISAISAAYFAINQVRRGLSDALELGRTIKEFEIFTGSLQTSQALMTGLRTLAAETPLTMGASTQTVRTLLQYGVSQQQVLDITRRLGDVSGASTERIQRLALAMGQITANGRLQGQELRQLVESGFNPLSFISQQTGEDMMELRIRMAEGKVSIEEVNEALIAATTGSGRFANQLKRIGEETPAGQLLKLQGAIEKLRTEAFVPLSVVVGAFATQALEFIQGIRGIGRTVVMLQRSTSGVLRQFGKDIMLVADAFTFLDGSGAMTVLNFLLETIVEIEQAAADMEKSMIDAAEGTGKSISEVDKSIEERIASLRREREELALGADEFMIMDAIRQGASEKYIAKLRQELELTRKVREEDEKRAEVARKAKKIIEERDKNKEWWKDWFRARRNQPEMLKTAKEFADLIKTPFDRLIEQLKELRGVAHILDEATMRAAEQQLKDQFIKSQMEKERVGPAAAATRGSVEEFRLLQEMSGQKDQDAERRHQEQLLENKLQNENLADASTKLSNLPEEIANRLETYFATSVA